MNMYVGRGWSIEFKAAAWSAKPRTNAPLCILPDAATPVHNPKNEFLTIQSTIIIYPLSSRYHYVLAIPVTNASHSSTHAQT